MDKWSFTIMLLNEISKGETNTQIITEKFVEWKLLKGYKIG